MSITVTNVADALASIIAAPDTFLSIEKKKEDKMYKGSRFFNTKYSIAGKKRDGWFSAKNVQLGKGIADPTDKNDKSTEHEGTRLQLTSSVSKAGITGEFLSKFNEQWPKSIKPLTIKPLTEGVPPMIDMDGCKLHEIIQTKTGKSSKIPGQPIEDGVIRWKLDFGKYPETHPVKALRGTQKSIILDASKPIEGKTGPYDFHPATVENDDGVQVPVNETNIHLFINDGCIAKELRWSMPSVAQSQSWVSLPMLVSKVVIEQGAEGGFSDETGAGNDETNIDASITTALDQANGLTESTSVLVDNIEPPMEESIGDILGEL